MDKYDAAKIVYKDHPVILENIETSVWMETLLIRHGQAQNDLVKSHLLHAAWWACKALINHSHHAVDHAIAYLNLAKGRMDDPRTGSVDTK